MDSIKEYNQVPLNSKDSFLDQKEIYSANRKEEIPLTFKDFTSMYKWPNMGSLRKIAYESDINGLKNAFLKVGRRRLVLPDTLFRLLKEKGSK